MLDPQSLDLGYLGQFLGAAYAEVVERGLRRHHPELRTVHGYLFQHLIESERSISELAQRAGVTQQAISKQVEELRRLGYLKVWADPTDRRARRVALAPSAWAAIRQTRRIRAQFEARLVRAVGRRSQLGLKEHLLQALTALSALERVAQRRVRAPDTPERAASAAPAGPRARRRTSTAGAKAKVERSSPGARRAPAQRR